MTTENGRSEILVLPDHYHWSGSDFGKYLVRAVDKNELIDMNRAPGVIDLSGSVIGAVADRLHDKLEQGRPYEYGAELRLRENSSIYATDLTTGYKRCTTETRSPIVEMKDFLRGILYSTRGFSDMWKRFPPETILFRMHSHPVDTPVSLSDTNGLVRLKEEDIIPFDAVNSRCGFLVVTDSVRMLCLNTKQTTLLNSFLEVEKVYKNIQEEYTPKENEPLITKKEFFRGPIPPQKYPGYIRRSIFKYVEFSRRVNYLMYASKDTEEQRNIYTRSY